MASTQQWAEWVVAREAAKRPSWAIRLTAKWPGSAVIYVPDAIVDHHVGEERLRFRYFLRRCWHEGMSKAVVVRLAGSSAGLERERRHVAEAIPAALLRDIRSCVTGNLAAFTRIYCNPRRVGFSSDRVRDGPRTPSRESFGWRLGPIVLEANRGGLRHR